MIPVLGYFLSFSLALVLILFEGGARANER